MRPQSRFVCALLFTVCLSGHSFASAATPVEKSPADISAFFQKAFTDAAKLREDAVSAVATQTEKPAAAILRLKAHGSLSGMATDPDADFAFGIVDVGQRLLSRGKPVEAEVFFLAAEQTLDSVATNTPDTDSQNKAMFLNQLGFIRWHYLNKAAQAKQDLEEAIRLQPNDKYLQRSRDALLNEHAELVVGQAEPKK